jgi:ABC-2 type transport system permease protein
VFRYYCSLYYLFLKQRLKILLEYRLNFAIGIGSIILMQGSGLLAVWVVMQRVPTLNGWTYDEILLIYGLLTLSKSIGHMFADNLWTLGQFHVRTGNFDRFLVRPINPLFHLLADRFCHDGIGNFLIGITVLIKSMIALGIDLTLLHALYLGVVVLSGGMIFIALNIITATSAFWIVDSVPLTRAVYELHEFAKYPLSFYHKSISVLITWLVPYGFTSFYPASYLIGDDIGWLAYAPPLVATSLSLMAYRIWAIGLRHYSGTGS